MTIDTVIEIGDFWVSRPQNGSQEIVFDDELIEMWIDRLQ